MHHLNKADHFILERYNTVGIVFRFSFSLRFRSLVKHFLQATIISIAKITSRLYDIYRSNNLALKNSITIYFIDRANAIQRRDLVNWDFFFYRRHEIELAFTFHSMTRRTPFIPTILFARDNKDMQYTAAQRNPFMRFITTWISKCTYVCSQTSVKSLMSLDILEQFYGTRLAKAWSTYD